MNPLTTTPGSPLPLGATIVSQGINFAIFSRNAAQVALVLFRPNEGPKLTEIPLDPVINRTGDLWHVLVHNLPLNIRYGYRIDGPHDPQGEGHWFSPNDLLLDPYARALTGSSAWGETAVRVGDQTPESNFQRRCAIIDIDFDWEGDRPLNIPLKDTIIYEMHVRGFTRNPNSEVMHPGTYAGVIEKIHYLKELGITAVELMPVTEFNENENININPLTGERLKNFWGYSPLAFFAPKASYAVHGRDGHQVWEFKEMVKALHKAGIEVILDVVFNHTAEGNEQGPVISFRGIDNSIYYLLDLKTRGYMNFSGCGNTVNCNHPLVRTFIVDCLHYWVMEMHVDGFRFDLASILGRDRNGEVLANPPVVEWIAEDPILANTKIIAEAWDAAGLYQVGNFSTSARWAEWNGKFRDEVRAFVCGQENTVATLATRIAGSSDLYQQSLKHPYNSINFITCHDGFTLYDLVSYNQKHNIANGENNNDGDNNNISWNSGIEGETGNARVKALRNRRLRTMATILFFSQGVPMITAGDEFGRTQKGNNNAYCQDNTISWLDWSLLKKHSAINRFFALLIALRKRHPILRRSKFFPSPSPEQKFQEIIWQSLKPGREDWSPLSKTLAFLLDGRAAIGERDDDFFVMLNANLQPKHFTVPKAPEQRGWYKILDTAALPPFDIRPEDEGIALEKNQVIAAGMTAVVLISKPI